MVVPAIVAGAGDHAARRFLEFFAATLRNTNTRMAYYRAVTDFCAWVERHKIGQLVDIEPLHVAASVGAQHESVQDARFRVVTLVGRSLSRQFPKLLRLHQMGRFLL
jgi:site-specific recombinase XerD